MLLTKIQKILNEQIELENQASFNYLSMAMWAEVSGYEGAADFLYRQSAEEREHMLKLIRFSTEMNHQPLLPLHKAPEKTYSDLRDVFEQGLKNELLVTQSINEKVAICLEVKDFRTFTFLQWFIKEQHEEELTMRYILQLFDTLPSEGLGLHTIDQALFDLPKKKEL